MINIEMIYTIIGFLFLVYSILSLVNKSIGIKKRFIQFLFWFVYGVSYFLPGLVSNLTIGCLVIMLAVLSLLGGFKLDKAHKGLHPTEKKSILKNRGKKVFFPALAVPVMTFIGVLICRELSISNEGNEAIIILSISTCTVFLICSFVFKGKPLLALSGANTTMGSIGVNVILPQMLATLGGVISVLGVGSSITNLVSQHEIFMSENVMVMTYALGMVLLTMIMGNAFAAFPIMTAGIGIPFIVHKFGGDPVMLCVFGMLCGFCGTMMTPVAANFNIIPESLLEIRKKGLVIKEQTATALTILSFNIIVMIFYLYK
ncbi:5-oxoproline transporter, DUF979 family subunit [Serratia fonticola]|uniref:DUF979 family protein n=1 Tax=Serratia fonticola TaxID=47917 RepID=A0AAW3WP01_SERFO|nr:DUF979 family protein [Serratia fonticola]MBC3212440.1 DUF979 family protein [Serratia fonticola]NYA12978.1 DUF979 family protein [Serratia fonticola]NYA32556.1 DUF979 family protein [Serratia fonticola]